MYVKDCCITELFDKPGLVQIDGLCLKCGGPVQITIVQKTLETVIETHSFEGTAINDQNQTFLRDGVCCECQNIVGSGS
jgi:hypothetical protein